MPKHLVSASLFLNLILGTLLFFSLRSADSLNPSPVPLPQPHGTPPPAASTNDSSFHRVWHWKDLDSDEFPTFITNLRSFGCPEQTIRDIITAEVNRDYDQKLADLNSSGLSANQYVVEKRRLDQERLSVLETLLPSSSLASSRAKFSDQSSATQSGSDASSPLEQPVSTPLFLLEPDSSLHLDETQVNAWNDLQRTFIAKIGGTSQNPYDPEYRKRWDEAQKDLDQAFQSKFGDDAFNLLLEKRKMADHPAAPSH